MRVTMCAFVIGVGLPTVALANDEDRGFLTRLLEDNLSGAGRSVQIEGFQGALSSRATMASLTIADDQGIWLRLTDVALDWQRTALLTGRLQVASLTAAEIVLERLPQAEGELPTPEAVPFALPDLPISVNIDQLQADRISLGPTILGRAVEARISGAANLAGGEGQVRLELERIDEMRGKLALQGSFANESRQLALDLALSEPQGGIAATLIGLPEAPALDLTIKGDAPLEDFTADVTLASDGQDRFAGQVSLQSPATGPMRFAVDLGGDVTPLFIPAYRPFFGPDVRVIAQGSSDPSGVMELSQLRLQTAALQLEGRAALAADGLPQSFDLALDLGAADGQPLRLPLGGDPIMVDGGALRLTFDAATGDRWALTGDLRGLATPELKADTFALQGGGRIGRDSGAQVDGDLTFDAQGLALQDPALARAVGPNIRGKTQFGWEQDAPLRLSGLEVQGSGYQAKGDLTLQGPMTDPAIIGTLTAALADMTQFSDLAGRRLTGAGDIGWSGRVSPLSGAFDVELNVKGRDLTLSLPEADALLQGESLIRLSALRGAEGVQIRDLGVQARSLDIKGQGWLRSSGPDLALDLDFGTLGDLGAGYGGALQAKARLVGSALDDNLALTLLGTGRDLSIGQPQADGFLRGQTEIDLQATLRDGTVDLARLLVNGADFRAEASGQVSASARDLKATVDLGSLGKAGAGFGGRLQGDVTYQMRDGREVANLSARGEGLSIGQPDADKLLRGTTTLTTQASREAGVIRLEGLRLQNPQLSANANAQQSDNGQRRIDLTAELANLGLFVPGIPGAVTLEGTVTEADGQLRLAVNARGPGGIQGQLGGTAALNFATANLTATGTADAALANAFLGPVAMRGPVRYDLTLNGAPSLAALSGQVGVSDLRVTLSNPPFSFTGVNGTANLNNGSVAINMTAPSQEGGTLGITGTVGLSDPFNGNLAIAINGLMLRDPQLYETRADGRVDITGPLTGGATIAGNVMLSETELRIPSTGLGGSAAIPDLYHIREPAAVHRTRQRAGLLDQPATSSTRAGNSGLYNLDLTISAPQKVFIRGRGLDAELGGTFIIRGTTANVQPSGGLELIRGRLDILGKRFAFTEGQMQMEGSMIPTIRLVATTETVDGSASVTLTGPADEPVIRFTSSPELPEEEVVARLLFGRGLTSLTPIQAAQLASAVATLTGKGGAGVVDRLRQNFGLDDFDVSASEEGAAAVRAGKYLSDNLYIDLKLDSEGQSEVSINLDLSNSVTVRAAAGNDGDSGIGIHYERDY